MYRGLQITPFSKEEDSSRTWSSWTRGRRGQSVCVAGEENESGRGGLQVYLVLQFGDCLGKALRNVWKK